MFCIQEIITSRLLQSDLNKSLYNLFNKSEKTTENQTDIEIHKTEFIHAYKVKLVLQNVPVKCIRRINILFCRKTLHHTAQSNLLKM